MKWLYDSKISIKLFSAFILIALIAGVVGYTGISQIDKIAKADLALYERETVPLTEINAINDTFQRLRVDNRTLIITQDSNAKQKLVDDIYKMERKIDENMALFEKTINTSEGQKEFQNLRAAFDKLSTFTDTFTKLNLDNNQTEAIVFLGKEGPPIVDGVDNSLSKLIDMKILQAKQTSATNQATASAATRIMILLISIGVMLALALGFLLNRIISKPLQNIATTADKVAMGNLNVRFDTSSQDEIGILSRSFATMVDNIRQIINEILTLSEAATAGQLSIRADACRYSGDYSRILQGINEILDAIVAPMHDTIATLNEMAQGNLSTEITSDFHGDYAQIKNAVNSSLKAFNEVLGQINEAAE